MMAQKSTILSEHKDRDDIETHTHIGIIVIFEIASCDAFVTRALPRVYRLRRKAFLSVLTSFHLDEAERIVLKRDDIRLASAAFPVAIEDLVFAALKEARGSLFSSSCGEYEDTSLASLAPLPSLVPLVPLASSVALALLTPALSLQGASSSFGFVHKACDSSIPTSLT